jgi:hypothetical protein
MKLPVGKKYITEAVFWERVASKDKDNLSCFQRVAENPTEMLF